MHLHAAKTARAVREAGDNSEAEERLDDCPLSVVHEYSKSAAPSVRIMRRPEVERATGMKRSTLYKAMADGRFPSPVRVGPNAVGWRSDEVAAWIADLPRAEVA